MSHPAFGPFDHIPTAELDEESRRHVLDAVLAGVALGSYDQTVVAWLAERPSPLVRSLAGLIARARRLERQRSRPRPYTRRRKEPGFVVLSPAVMQMIRGGLFG